MKRILAIAALWSFSLAPAQSENWPVFGYDSARTGYNAAESTIDASNVAQLKERWQIKLGAVADSTPVFLSKVNLGSRTANMLFLTARNGTSYGIEASSGKILWKFTTPGDKSTTSTPAADAARSVIYVPGIDGYVHELHAATGAEMHDPGFPVQITVLPETEEDASPLNLANGRLYAVTSGFNGDAEPYDGHVVAVVLKTGAVRIFNSLCSGKRALPTATSCEQQRSGIWARGGVVADPDFSMDGRVDAATGNGDFDAANGGKDYGDTVLSLTRRLSLVDYYTPSDYKKLQTGDQDLGSTSPGMLPRQSNSATPLMMVQGGKDDILRLIDRTHMGGLDGQLQNVALPDRLFASPAIWTDGSGTTRIYLGFPTTVQSFTLQTGSSGQSSLQTSWSANLSGSSLEGTSPVIAGGVLFVATGGAIEAFDAQQGTLLWTSAQSSAGGTIGKVHWQSPIVVDGSVYCADQNGNLTAYWMHQSSSNGSRARGRKAPAH